MRRGERGERGERRETKWRASARGSRESTWRSERGGFGWEDFRWDLSSGRVWRRGCASVIRVRKGVESV